jgi:cell division protein FtsQ
MLQLIVRKYRWFILLCFLFFLTTFNLNNSNFFNLFFKVENVQYNKTMFVDESLKSEAMDLIMNKNLFLLDKKKIIDLFYQSPWVEKVEFKKKLPNQLYINITEYFPVAYFKENNQLYLVNNNYKNSLVSDDINTDDIIKLDNVREMSKFEFFLKKLSRHSDFLPMIKEIHYIYENRWNIILKDGSLVKLGSHNMEEQVKNLQLILKNKKISTIDMRIVNQIIITHD